MGTPLIKPASALAVVPQRATIVVRRATSPVNVLKGSATVPAIVVEKPATSLVNAHKAAAAVAANPAVGATVAILAEAEEVVRNAIAVGK